MSNPGIGLYSDAAIAAADAANIPREIFLSLVENESSFNQSAVSSAGAIGLTQLMPSTAAQLGVDPYDPTQNLNGGATYLASLYQKFGNWTDALAAYNAGPGNLQAGMGYAQNVLAGAAKLGFNPSATSTASTAAPSSASSAPAGGTSSLPNWLQSALTAIGLPSVSFTNVAIYGGVIAVLLLLGFYGIKSLFPQKAELVVPDA